MRTLLALSAAWLAAAAPLRAADGPPTPAVEVTARSVNDLLGNAEYLGDLVGQPEAAKQAVGLVKAFTDPDRGLEGFDPARPVGLYAAVSPAVVDSPAVLLLPVADDDAVLGFLKGKLNLDPKKAADGSYAVRLPNLPVPVHFRFADGYAHVTAVSADAVAPGRLIAPKTFFAARGDAVVSAAVHFDRLPAEVKKTFLGQLEMRTEQTKAEDRPGESRVEKQFRGLGSDLVVDAVQSLLTDGRTLRFELRVDPKADELTAGLTLTARDGSPLAKWVRGLDAPSRAAAVAAGAKSPLIAGSLRLTAPADWNARLGRAVDDAVAESIEKANESDKPAAKIVWDAIRPTLKAGVIDAGLLVTGPDEGGKVGLVVGVRVVDGAGIEKAARTLAPFVPEGKGTFEFDVEKVGGVTVQKLVRPENVADLERLFGTDTVWLGTSDGLVLVGMEPDGTLLRAAAKRPPTPGTLAGGNLDAARLVRATEKGVPADKLDAVIGDAVGNGTAAVKLNVTGGKEMTAKLTVSGRTVKLAVAVDQAKKGGE